MEKYPWYAAYRAAIFETDNADVSLRIYEALAAIEQRRLSYLEIDDQEAQALETAEQGLRVLKTERVERINGSAPRDSQETI